MTSQTVDATLDARGMSCPLPVLRARKMLKRMETGQILEIAATDPGAMKDFRSFCVQTGDTLISAEEESENGAPLFRFLIARGEET